MPLGAEDKNTDLLQKLPPMVVLMTPPLLKRCTDMGRYQFPKVFKDHQLE